MRIQCSIPLWLRLAIVWAVLLVADAAVAQKSFPGIDSAEKVISALRTAIPIGQTITAGTPFKVAVTIGDGAKFSKVTPKPFIVTCSPQAETDLTGIEEFKCSAVSNDTLTLIARAPAIGRNLVKITWPVGSRISIRLTGEYIKSLQDTVNWLITNGPGSGTVTSITFQSPLTGGNITSTGTVTIPQATSSTDGYLTSGNWSTFNNKQSTISVTSPITLAGGTNIGIQASDATHNGYLSMSDWTTFNNKFLLPDTTGKTLNVLTVKANGTVGWSTAGSGTVTSVNLSGGATGLTVANGPITSAGTMQLGGTLAIASGGTNAGTAAQALTNLLPDSTGKTGFYLRVDSTGGFKWRSASGGSGGTGTVTSVAQTVPAFLSISGSPVTTSGTLAITLSGTALPYSSGGTDQTSYAKGDLLYASATNVLSKLTIGASAKVLTVISGLPSWQTPATGTVTSVDMTVPTGFAVSGNPITSSGTLAVTLSSESANTFLGAPDGSSGTPTFRTLVSGDIPSLDAGKITSGALVVARGGTGLSAITAHTLIVGNGTSVATLSAVGGDNTVLGGNAAADPTWKTLSTGASLTGNGIGTPFAINLANGNIFTAAQEIDKNGIAATYTTGLTLGNTTASTNGTQVQQSPGLLFDAHGWSTTATAADSELVIRITDVPVAAANATSKLNIDFGNTNLGFTNKYSFASNGTLTATTFSGALSGNATTATALATPRAIYGNNFDGSAALTQIIASTYGGTGNGFTKFSGPTTSEKTFTLPDASATLAYLAGGQTFTGGLTINGGLTLGTALAIANGGTNTTTYTTGDILYSDATNSLAKLPVGASTTVLHGGTTPSYSAVNLATDVTGSIGVANGGTGSASLKAHDLLAGNGTSAIDTIASRASGLTLTSNGTPWYPTMRLSTMAGSLIVRDTFAANGTGSSNILKNVFEYGLGSGIPMFATMQMVGTRASNNYQVLVIDSTAVTSQIVWQISSSGTFASATVEGINLLAVSNSPNGAIYGAQNYYSNGTTASQVKDTISDAAIQDSSIVLANMIAATNGSYYCDIRSIASGKVVLNVINSSHNSITSGTTLTASYFVVNSTPDGRIVTGKYYFKNTSGGGISTDTSFNILSGDVTDTNVYIFAVPLHDANSTATYNYHVAVEPKSTWPAGGFRLRFHNSGTLSPTSVTTTANNEGCTFLYAIVKPSQKLATQSNWTFSGAPVAITNASNQIILGSGTTTTLNANTPAASSTYTVRDVGTTGDFLLETTNLSANPNYFLTSGATRGQVTSTQDPTARNLVLTGGLAVSTLAEKTTNYTVTATDCVVPVDCTGGNVVVTLPASPANGQVVVVSKDDAGVNTLTVNAGAGTTIIGGNVTMATQAANVYVYVASITKWIKR